MAEIAPFAAIRYELQRAGTDLSHLLAPPYDVLSAGDKQRLLARNSRNIVAIDLPHVPPKEAGPAEAYVHAARTLLTWLSDGTLTREERPALYVYHQLFEFNGRRFVRKKFIARLRLVPFSKGVVLPHEQTFGGPKEDRLALTRATRCNLSPIFGLFSDPADAVGRAFIDCTSKPPDATAILDGVENRLWIVTDAETIESVCAALADKVVYIADGHHRYGTAMMYRDELAEHDGGPLPYEHPANFTMFVLGSMDDPGCLILPYHRVLVASLGQAPLRAEQLIEVWSAGVSQVPTDSADLVLFEGASGRSFGLTFADRARMNKLAPDRGAAWRQLDAAYLHRYLLDELIPSRWRGPAPALRYVNSADDARKLATTENGVALLMRPTPMAQLRAVSETGDLMPQKSTYFYPKLATGLTINPLY